DSANLGVAFSNPTLSEVSVRLTAFGYDSQLIAGTGITNPVTLKLPAAGQRALLASDIFGSGIAGKSGWIEVKSTSSAVKGFFLVFDAGLTYIDGAELQDTPAPRIVFPKVSALPLSPTIISFVNTGEETLKFAALSFYDNSGRVVARKLMILEPHTG